METQDFQRKMMARAINLAKEGGKMDNGGPFGAVITRGEEIVSEARNEVIFNGDCTQHAELRAIQRACTNLHKNDLSGCVLYTSCEPCLMCLGAAYWANFDYIYYAASALDAKDYGFKYSNLYYNSNADKRHEEFKMIQICRDDAVAVWQKIKREQKLEL